MTARPRRSTANYNNNNPLGLPGLLEDAPKQWSEQELHIFFEELVKHGKTWTQIAESLPARTPLDIESLYKNHENLIKTLLAQQANLPPPEANADPILPDLSVFVASVHDHYSALYTIQQRSSEAENESPTILGRTKAVSRTGSAKKKAGKKDSPTKTKRKSRRKLEYGDDEEASSDAEESDELSQPTHVRRSARAKGQSTDDVEGVEELLALALSSHGDKSDGQPSTGRATRAQNSAGQDKLPPRLRNKSVKDQSAKSSSVASPARSVSPTRMNVIRVPGSDKLLEARLTSALANRKFRQWCLYEFFCSTIDQDWFAQNDFQQCLNGLGMESVTHLTRPKWRYVRSVIGKPRRVSHAFFMEERTNLNAYRMTCRKSPEEKEEHKYAEDEEPSQSSKEEHVVTLIPVGSPVLFYDEDCKDLLRGVIAAPHSNCCYDIKASSGEVKSVEDTWVMSYEEVNEAKRKFEALTTSVAPAPAHEEKDDSDYSTSERPTKRRRVEPVKGGTCSDRADNTYSLRTERVPSPERTRAAELPEHVKLSKDSLQKVAELIWLLEKKDGLVLELHSLNDEAERLTLAEEALSEDFRHRYATVVVAVGQLNAELETALNTVRQLKEHSKQSAGHTPINRASWWTELNAECKNTARLVVQRILGDMPTDEDKKHVTTVEHSVALLQYIAQCTELDLNDNEVALALNAALTALRPRTVTSNQLTVQNPNMRLYAELEAAVNELKNKMTKSSANNKESK